MLYSSKISIIVPFYNVEGMLFNKCVDSILRQSYENFELLIIDDGSKDECKNNLDEVAKRDRRIRIIHKENGGVSTARNIGVFEADSEYCTFIDADDVVHCKYLEQAVEFIEQFNVDYVIGATLEVSKKEYDLLDLKHSENILNSKPYKIYDKDTIDEFIPSLVASNRIIRFPNGGYINRGPVARLLKTSIAKIVKFPEGIPIGEDVIWNQYVLKECNRLAVVENIWYYYLQNDNSAIHRYRETAIENIQKEGMALFNALDTTKDQIYRAWCAKVFSETRLIICSSYLTRKENQDNFIKKWKQFIKLKKIEPWNLITGRFLRLGDKKEKMIYFMFKSGFYYPIAYFKDNKLNRG